MTDDTISRQGVLRLLNAVPSEEFATKAMLISGVKALPSAQPRWIPWDKKTRNSMVNTLQTLYRLAYNIHGVMDVVDDDNVKRLIALLEGGQDE